MTRHAPVCGSADDPAAPARLHVIFFDSALAHGSALFRVGPMQLILTLLERGLVKSSLVLDDPLAALHSYSPDPTLKATAQLTSGEYLTALELQSAYLEEVKRGAAQGIFDEIVPRAGEIISLWEDTLVKLANADLLAVARRGVDWVLKLMAIESAQLINVLSSTGSHPRSNSLITYIQVWTTMAFIGPTRQVASLSNWSHPNAFLTSPRIRPQTREPGPERCSCNGQRRTAWR